MATSGTRGKRTITGELSVGYERRIDDRSSRRSISQPAEPPALGALVRLLARQSARQWLKTVEAEPADGQDRSSVQPVDCDGYREHDDVD